jgi:hypothetical protein
MAKVTHKPVKFSPEEMAIDFPADADPSRMIPVIGCGIHAAEMRGEPPLKVKYVIVDDASVAFSLDDGRKVSAPLDWYPRLKHATPGERNSWRLLMGGRAVLWRNLGLAISAKAILEGTRANESAAALKKWIDSRKTKKAS